MGYSASGGPRGLGQITDASSTQADGNQLLTIIAEVATRRVGTVAEREALPVAKCFAGLEWEETDTGRTVVWANAQDGWTPKEPKRLEVQFKRSDGAEVVNNGTTAMRWETGAINTLGCTLGSDANGAYVTVKETGYYWVSAELGMAFSGAVWGGIDIGKSAGAIFLGGGAGEFPTPDGYTLGNTMRLVYISSITARLYVALTTNKAGVMRAAGTFRIVRAPRL